MSSDKLKSRHPPNIVRNQKYNVASFFPIVLYEQFKFFFNLYFLLVALSQFVPALRIGTRICPLQIRKLNVEWYLSRIPSHLHSTSRVRVADNDWKRSLR